MKVISDFWDNTTPDITHRHISAGFDTNYPVRDRPNCRLAVIDLDTDKYRDDLLKIPEFINAPANVGGKGAKIFIIVDYGDEPIPPTTQYYKVKDLEGVAAGTKKDISPALEVFTGTKYAVVYGEHEKSTHSSPLFYRFIRGFGDPIPTITLQEFREAIEEFTVRCNLVPRSKTVNTFRKTIKKKSDDDLNIQCDILDYLRPLNPRTSGGEIHGEHPIHGSNSKAKKNLSVNTIKGVWTCRRCSSGGGVLAAAAVASKIYQCDEMHSGWIQSDKSRFMQLLEWLEERGDLIRDSGRVNAKRVAESGREEEGSGFSVIIQDGLPSAEELVRNSIEYKYQFIDGPPRGGKTHIMMDLAVNMGETCNFIAPRHSICEHAARIASSKMEALRDTREKTNIPTLVHLAGKNRMCKFKDQRQKDPKFNCRVCPLYPNEDHASMVTAQNNAGDILQEHLIITDELFEEYDKICPYYTTRYAEAAAKICLTVPYFATHTDPDRRIRDRTYTVIDENNTVENFYPGSFEMMSNVNVPGNRHVDNKRLLNLEEKLSEMEKNILEKRKHRKWDKIILEVIRTTHEISTLIETFRVGENGGMTFENLQERIGSLSLAIMIDGTPVTEDEKKKVLEKVGEYELNQHENDNDTSMQQFFECFLFRYEPNPLSWQGKRKKKLYLVGDERKLIKEPIIDKGIFIGSNRMHRFIQDMQKLQYEKDHQNWQNRLQADPCAESKPSPCSVKKYDVQKFPYADNFIYIVVGKGLKSSDQKSLRDSFLHYFHGRNDRSIIPDVVPALALTSSEERQKRLADRFDDRVYLIRQDDQEFINRDQYSTGSLNIFYTQSQISRGVDVPNYDLMFVSSTDFAFPYENAVIQYAKSGKDIDKVLLERAVLERQARLTDEVTNCVLRISPIWGGNTTQAKIVVVTDDDFTKIHEKITKGAYVFPLQTRDQFDMVWITMHDVCKKVVRAGEVGYHITEGVAWPEAKLRFDAIRDIKEFPSPAKEYANRILDEVIDRHLMNNIRMNSKHGVRASRKALIKYVENNLVGDKRFDDLRGVRIGSQPVVPESQLEKRIKYRLHELAREQYIRSEHEKSEYFYTFRLDKIKSD